MAHADPAAVRGRNLIGLAIQVVLLVLLLTILAGVVFVVLQVASITRAPNDLASGAGQAVSGVQTAIENITDPSHPPSGLAYDTEFTALDVWHVGDVLPGGTDYALTVSSIQRRPAAPTADAAEYAVIHAELRQPRVTRLLGQVVRSDSDGHDYAVYKGEIFRIGRLVYRVNWVSQQQNTVAVGVMRNPDSVTQPLKFQYD
jgi:hypothetical protein